MVNLRTYESLEENRNRPLRLVVTRQPDRAWKRSSPYLYVIQKDCTVWLRIAGTDGNGVDGHESVAEVKCVREIRSGGTVEVHKHYIDGKVTRLPDAGVELSMQPPG